MPDGEGRGSPAAGQVTGIERAVFGAVTADDVTAWLDRHVTRRLSARVSQVLFRTGRVSAVYGLRLSDGTGVVAKVYGRPSTQRAWPPPWLARARWPGQVTARHERFSAAEQAAAAAAATWVMAYNARRWFAKTGHEPMSQSLSVTAAARWTS
jgi:hypothetical protein